MKLTITAKNTPNGYSHSIICKDEDGDIVSPSVASCRLSKARGDGYGIFEGLVSFSQGCDFSSHGQTKRFVWNHLERPTAAKIRMELQHRAYDVAKWVASLEKSEFDTSIEWTLF